MTGLSEYIDKDRKEKEMMKRQFVVSTDIKRYTHWFWEDLKSIHGSTIIEARHLGSSFILGHWTMGKLGGGLSPQPYLGAAGTGTWGVVGLTTFTDSSASAHSVTAYGNVQISTAQKKFGTGSGLFDGNGDYLSIPDSDDFDFGTGDFTIDFWFYPTNGSINHTILDKNYTTNYLIQTDAHATTPSMRLFVNGSLRILSSISQSLNTWVHYAIVRNGNIVTLYVNGVSGGTWDATSVSINGGTPSLYIGQGAAIYYAKGYIDEFRISNGIARWTTTFTPPIAEYTTDSYTKLLLHLNATDISTDRQREFLDKGKEQIRDYLVGSSSAVKPTLISLGQSGDTWAVTQSGLVSFLRNITIDTYSGDSSKNFTFIADLLTTEGSGETYREMGISGGQLYIRDTFDSITKSTGSELRFTITGWIGS